MYAKLLLLFLASLSLSGCALFDGLFRPTPIGCHPVVTASGNSFSFKGLDLPLRPDKRFNVGEMTFEPKQIQEIQESVQMIDQYRQSQCLVLNTLLLAKPNPVEKIGEIGSNIAEANKKILDIVMTLKSGKNAEKALVDIKNVGEKLLESHPKNVDAGKTSFNTDALEKHWLTSFDAHSKSVARLIEAQGRIALPEAKVTVSFSVLDFETGRITLNPQMKTDLLSAFTTALNKRPVSETAQVMVIGYADRSGLYLRNVDLGMRRASAVARYLEQSFPGRLSLTVTSGGVSDHQERARRVDVLLS